MTEDFDRDAAPFPTIEGGAVPAEDIFHDVDWFWFLTVSLQDLPIHVMQQMLQGTTQRLAGSKWNRYSIFHNDASIAILIHAKTADFNPFRDFVLELLRIWGGGPERIYWYRAATAMRMGK